MHWEYLYLWIIQTSPANETIVGMQPDVMNTYLNAIMIVLVTVVWWFIRQYQRRIEEGFKTLETSIAGIQKTVSSLAERVSHLEGIVGIKYRGVTKKDDLLE